MQVILLLALAHMARPAIGAVSRKVSSLRRKPEKARVVDMRGIVGVTERHHYSALSIKASSLRRKPEKERVVDMREKSGLREVTTIACPACPGGYLAGKKM